MELEREELDPVPGPRPHFHYWRPVDLRDPTADIARIIVSLIGETRLPRWEIHRLIQTYSDKFEGTADDIDRLFDHLHSANQDPYTPEVWTLIRSRYGYVDRTKAYRRLREWQLASRRGYCQAVVMTCRGWEICSAPLT